MARRAQARKEEVQEKGEAQRVLMTFILNHGSGFLSFSLSDHDIMYFFLGDDNS